MKTVLSDKPLPRDWSGLPGMDRCILHKDIAITNGNLRMKLLVFKDKTGFRRFWNVGLRKLGHGNYLESGVRAVTSSLCFDVVDYKKGEPADQFVLRDPVYFTVAAFHLKGLTVETVTHECVHAAVNYSERAAGKGPWSKIDPESWDERICYPAGRLVAAVTKTLIDAGIRIPIA